MAALTVDEASQSHARVPRRRGIHPAWYVVATLLVAFGSAAGATVATRWLLGAPPHRAPAPARPKPTLPAVRDGGTLGGGSTLAVGMGATQSYAGLAITVDQLRIVASNGFVGAPAGSHLAIVTVTLMNTDPVRALSYNAAEFWLSTAAGDAHHEVFSASGQPLGTGQVAPHSRLAGEVAFLVTATPTALAPDPQIVFAATPDFTLRWDVPLLPLLP